MVLVAAFILVRLLRRWLPQAVDRYLAARDADRPTDDDHVPSPERRLAIQAARERSRQRARTLGLVLVSIGAATIWVIAIAIVLSELGVDLAPLLAGAGVVGIAVGLGAQQIVSDLLSGFFIVLEDQYAVGDVVDLGDAVGEVEQISLRYTRVRDLQGQVWFVPSSEIRRVGNLTKMWSRAVIDVEVAYGSDLERASQLMHEAAVAVREAGDDGATIIDDPTVLGVETLGASGITIRMLVRTEAGEQWTVGRRIRREITTRFATAGIEIPFPQGDIRIRAEGGEAASVGPLAGPDDDRPVPPPADSA